MKKIICLSVALLALFLYVWFYHLAPAILAIKDDFYYVADVVSKDNLYDVDKQEFKGESESKTKFSYRAVGREGNDLLIANFFDVRNLDDQKIFSVERLLKVNPKSGNIFAPKRIDKKPFTYRHVNYSTPVEMKYAGEENLYGVKVYRYEANYHADQTQELSDLPEVGESLGINLDLNLQLWIEPVSGWLVNYQDKTTAYYYDLQTQNRRYPWNKFTNTFSQDSIRKHAETAQRENIKLNLIQRDTPILVSIMILVFTLIFCCYKSSGLEKFDIKISTVWVWVATIVVGIGVLMFWGLNIEIFPNANPEYATMNPMTAVSFVLVGLLAILRTRAKVKSTVILSIILSSIGLLRLSDVFLGTAFGLDLWLFASKITAVDARPARMSIITAASFVLLGLSFIFSLKWLRVGRLFAVVVSLLGLSGCFVYVFSEISDLARAFFYSMALNTSILFFILGLFLSFAQDLLNIKDLAKRLLLFLVFIVPLVMTLSATRFAEQVLSEKNATKFEHEAALIELLITNKIDLHQAMSKSDKNVGVKIYNGAELLYQDTDAPKQPRYYKIKTVYVDSRPLTVEFVSYPNLYEGSLDKLIPAVFLTLGLTTSILLLVLFFVTLAK